MDARNLGQIVIRDNAANIRTDRHWLSGTIKVEGRPESRRVALFLRDPLTPVAVTRGKADGTYVFRGIPEYPERSLKAVCYDDDLQRYNAQVCDFLTQGQEPAAREQ